MNPDQQDEFGTPYYPDLSSFVRHSVVEVMLRGLDGRTRTWCPQWWEHAEAVFRLEALHVSWEAHRINPDLGGMTCWLRDHADYHLQVLTDPDGTFRGCSPERGHQPRGSPPRWEEPPAFL